jgi:hypothetical protein
MYKSSPRPRRPGEASPRQFRGVYEVLLMICLVVHVAGYLVPIERDSPGAANNFDENNPIAVAERANKSNECLSFLSFAWRHGKATCRVIEKAGKDCSPVFDSSLCSSEEWRAGGLGGLRIFDQEEKKESKKEQKPEVVAKLKVRGDVGPPANIDYVMPSWFRLRPDDTSDQDDGGLDDKEKKEESKKKLKKKSKTEQKPEVVKQMIFNETVPSFHFIIKMENTLRLKNGVEDHAEFENEDFGKDEDGEGEGEGVGEGVEAQMDKKMGEESGGGDDVDAQDVAVLVCVGFVSALVLCGLAAGCFYLIRLAIKINTVQGPVGSLGTSVSSSTASSSSSFSSTASSTASTVSTPISFDDGDVVPGAESSPRAQEWDHTMPMAEFHRDENTPERENTEEGEVFFADQHAESKTGG